MEQSWITQLSEAEAWFKEKEETRLGIDKTERPNTKWVFSCFSNVYEKVVLDDHPLLGTVPLSDWLCNLAHCGSMVVLDTYHNNICLWRCIAVHHGPRPDRSTKVAGKLAMSFFKFLVAPDDWPKTPLDQFDKV